MHILALEPFYGGSHKAFVDGWAKHSRHQVEIVGLPARHWKWRMRHAPMTLSATVAQRFEDRDRPDCLFCSDMLNLPEFLGLAPGSVRDLPSIVYFHENQLTYPAAVEHERDLHFGFTNITTAIAADEVWFNSEFHRTDFLSAAEKLCGRLPDYAPNEAIADVAAKSLVCYPGIAQPRQLVRESSNLLRIGWVARWEHDKSPEDFFSALRLLKENGRSFGLYAAGERFTEVPDAFTAAEKEFTAEARHWGFAPDRNSYERLLADVDVVVSTARHEFFGLAIAEACSFGAVPVVPDRLVYPELYGCTERGREMFLYDGSVESLARRLQDLAEKKARGESLASVRAEAQRAVARFSWDQRARILDERFEQVVANCRG